MRQILAVAIVTELTEIRDAKGQHLGTAYPSSFIEEDIAIAKSRIAAKEPGLTTAQVLDYLRRLAEEEESPARL